MRDPMTSELRADVEMIAMSALLPIVELLAMSALGHRRTFAVQKSMSALLPKADMWCTSPCLLCAKSGHCRLFDQLIRSGEKGLR